MTFRDVMRLQLVYVVLLLKPISCRKYDLGAKIITIPIPLQSGAEANSEFGQSMVTSKKNQINDALRTTDSQETHSRRKASVSSYYQVLEVSPDASDCEIREKTFYLIRKIHLLTMDPTLSLKERKRITARLNHIHRAYAVLKDPLRRRHYDLAHGFRQDSGNIQKKADMIFQEGRQLYDLGKYEECCLSLTKAVDLWKHDARYYRLLALAKKKLPDHQRKAEAAFIKAIELDPKDPNGYVTLGLFYKGECLPVKAERQFRKALSIDPNHRQAKYHLIGKGRKRKKKNGFFRFLGDRKRT
jgi:tetratricopeptide (TPR) repeat protein